MNRDPEGFYEALGLQPGASIDEIKKAYTKLQIKYHPNGAFIKTKLKTAKTEEEKEKIRKEFEEKSSKLNQAKSVLMDENKKRQYDSGMMGRNGQGFGGFTGGFNFSDVHDIFDMFSGVGRGASSSSRQVKKVKSIDYALDISFKDAFLGKTCSFNIDIEVICSGCKGFGGDNVKDCSTCQGRGRVQSQRRLGPIITVSEDVCNACSGEGKVCAGNKCTQCRGAKYLKVKEKINVVIRKGIKNGERIVFKEKGHQRVGHITGDIVFITKILPNNKFERVNDHIVSTIDIPLYYALVGGSVYFEHVDNRGFEINLKPIQDFSKSIIIYGEGFASSSGSTGNLYLKPKIVVPPNINKAKLAEILPTSVNKSSSMKYISKIGGYDNLPQSEANSHRHGNESSDEGYDDGFEERFRSRSSWFPF